MGGGGGVFTIQFPPRDRETSERLAHAWGKEGGGVSNGWCISLSVVPAIVFNKQRTKCMGLCGNLGEFEVPELLKKRFRRLRGSIFLNTAKLNSCPSIFTYKVKYYHI